MITQTNKMIIVHSLNCTITWLKYKAQPQDGLVLESEMVTNKHVTEVVRNGCVNHQAKRVDSKAILQLIATYLAALIICIIKQTNTNIANQTNKLNK